MQIKHFITQGKPCQQPQTGVKFKHENKTRTTKKRILHWISCSKCYLQGLETPWISRIHVLKLRPARVQPRVQPLLKSRTIPKSDLQYKHDYSAEACQLWGNNIPTPQKLTQLKETASSEVDATNSCCSCSQASDIILTLVGIVQWYSPHIILTGRDPAMLLAPHYPHTGRDPAMLTHPTLSLQWQESCDVTHPTLSAHCQESCDVTHPILSPHCQESCAVTHPTLSTISQRMLTCGTRGDPSYKTIAPPTASTETIQFHIIHPVCKDIGSPLSLLRHTSALNPVQNLANKSAPTLFAHACY